MEDGFPKIGVQQANQIAAFDPEVEEVWKELMKKSWDLMYNFKNGIASD